RRRRGRCSPRSRVPPSSSRMSTPASERRSLVGALALGLLGAGGGWAAGVAGDPAREAPAPFARVVGTAQDGGLPHAACSCERCARARHDPSFRRRVASLAIVDPGSEPPAVFLIDATPDLEEQLARLSDVRRGPAGRVDRAPLDGVLLTHAHIGHYLGLAFLGYEVVHVEGLPVWASPRLAGYLRGNGPWSQLTTKGEIELREISPGVEVALTGALRVTPFVVPHRDEYSDTLGFLVAGPRRRLLYVPDTDRWETWDPPLGERLAGVDVAILDGTFYSTDELPGRSVGEIGHPLIQVTMDLLEDRVRAGALDVYFTHLNHSNPALDPDSAAAAEIRRRGFSVLAEGLELPL
ncbi:MAG: MBL fold metallo-hydrolase, partial [Thermoanaerobaculia bacterium]